MIIAGEEDEPDEEVRVDNYGYYKGERVLYSDRVMSCKLLEQSLELIVCRNSSEVTQTILWLAVMLKLEWPL